MLPQASQQVQVAVVPGDSVTVSIDEQCAGTGVWQISITNITSGQTYQTTVNYTSSESSTEWIQEAPASSSGVLPLDFNLNGDLATFRTTFPDFPVADQAVHPHSLAA